MDLIGEIDIRQILDILLLLLIGVGPKVTLVPSLDLAADLDSETQNAVARKVIKTAGGECYGQMS